MRTEAQRIMGNAIRVRLRIERITCIYLPFGHRLLPAEERGQAMRSDRRTFYFLREVPIALEEPHPSGKHS